MVYSMTGYGRASETINGRCITVEIKSVNHRYFEYYSKLPRGLSAIEDKIKQLVAKEISRGKTELTLTIIEEQESDTIIEVNLPLAKKYYTAFHKLSQELIEASRYSVTDIAKMPDVLTVAKTQQDLDELFFDVKQVVYAAVQGFKEMREQEGKKLKSDILAQLCTLEKNIAELKFVADSRVSEYTKRLYDKLCLLLADRAIDDARVLTEAAIFADKTDTNEELVRLQSHIEQFVDILDASEQKGRKLDFLLQEMNREVNTIGSKIQSIELTRLVVDMKSLLEKVREQIQNIE